MQDFLVRAREDNLFSWYTLHVDKNKFIVDTYNKIAQKYTDQYFNDLSDKPYIDKFLNLIPINGIYYA